MWQPRPARKPSGTKHALSISRKKRHSPILHPVKKRGCNRANTKYNNEEEKMFRNNHNKRKSFITVAKLKSRDISDNPQKQV